ncbi:MAG: hypothetical protein ACKO91_12660 [Acidimicrobiales bacterium]
MGTARIAATEGRPGVDVFIGEGDAPIVSDTWTVGGWVLRFARLDAGQSLPIEQGGGEVWAKVVTGRLTEPDRGAYPAVGTVATTRVAGDRIVAGPDGAVVTLITKTAAVGEVVAGTADLPFGGPLTGEFSWWNFGDRFGAYFPAYVGADAFGSPGWHLLDARGEEIAYVWTWICGKGTDMVTHNHGNPPGPGRPAFAEVHLVLHNGTGQGGMYETPEPGSPERVRTPAQQSEEHGPFFAVDADGAPVLRDNGAVTYPWHSWEAGPDDGQGPAYDVILPFEITAPYSRVTA